jgi:hypothetical protein
MLTIKAILDRAQAMGYTDTAVALWWSVDDQGALCCGEL